MARSMLSFRLCLLLALPTAVLLCSCIRKSQRELLCEADYVIRGEVTEVEDVLSTDESNFIEAKLLHVNVQEVYKNPKMFSWTNGVVKIRTGPQSAACGWIPNKGVYMIAGRINSDGPSISNCDYTRTWSAASQDDKDLISEVASDGSCGGGSVTSPHTPTQTATQTVVQTATQRSSTIVHRGSLAAVWMTSIFLIRSFLPN